MVRPSGFFLPCNKFDIHKNSLLLTNPCCREDEAADPDTSFLTGADSSDFIDLTAKF